MKYVLCKLLRQPQSADLDCGVDATDKDDAKLLLPFQNLSGKLWNTILTSICHTWKILDHHQNKILRYHDEKQIRSQTISLIIS